jgi:carbon starvation protein
MNTLFLVAATVVAFAFGYRFYAKLLALEVFRLDTNYSTRAQSHPDGQDFVPTHRHLLLGHHVAAVTGIGAFAAPIVTLDWGWIPAFLWITIGSTVAAGTYAIGAFWLSSRFPEELGHLARQLVGVRARAVVRLLSVVILLVVVAAAAGFGASLFHAFPSAVLPSLAVVLSAWIFGSYLHGRAQSRLLPASVVSLIVILLLTGWLGGVSVSLSGQLTVSLGDRLRFAIDPVVVWIVLLLVYAFVSARLPVWKLARPRGFLVAMMGGVMLLLFFVALIVQHPTIDAPQFHSPPSGTRALPWLFLMVGTGALAGWHLLIVRGVTGRELQRETDARYVGYGVAIIQGLVALSALLLAASAFGDRAAALAGTGPLDAADFPRAAVFYVERYARLLSVIGIESTIVRPFAATVLAGLSLAVLEAAVRALVNGLVDIVPPPPAMPGRRDGRRMRLWLVVLSGAVLALHDGHGLGGVKAWPLLAVASLWFAAAGFALMARALQRAQQPTLIPVALGGAVAVLAVWSTVVQLWAWWQGGTWMALAAGAVVAVLAVFLLFEALIAGRHAPQTSGET